MDSVARDRWPEDPRQITLPFSYILNPFFCILTVRLCRASPETRESPPLICVLSRVCRVPHFHAPRAPRAAPARAPAADADSRA